VFAGASACSSAAVPAGVFCEFRPPPLDLQLRQKRRWRMRSHFDHRGQVELDQRLALPITLDIIAFPLCRKNIARGGSQQGALPLLRRCGFQRLAALQRLEPGKTGPIRCAIILTVLNMFN